MEIADPKILCAQFEASQLPAVWQLFHDTVHAINRRDYTAEQIQAWAPETPDRELWLARLLAPSTIVALRDRQAKQEAQVVGFARLEPDGHLDLFYVHHQCQSQGVGTVLMTHLFELARTSGTQRIWSEVSITAKPFFERRGFTSLGSQTVVSRNVQFVNYRMEWRLSEG